MIKDDPALPRPLACEDGKFFWNIQRVPRTLPDGKTTHPGRSRAIFVVHGMGRQHWTETAAQLRGGFEDAFEAIAEWQKKHDQPQSGKDGSRITLPPPFILDGYWANYEDIAATFPEDWRHFNERERQFFSNLWTHRVISTARTIWWALKQQVRLLSVKVLHEVGLLAWILYWPLQLVSLATLLAGLVRYREAVTGFLNDVRLYLDPQGVAERAIVQRIDERVGREFLRMLGLDWEFRPLPQDELIEAGGERLVFERVVWVAHSLGTIISYNVLSALFHKAEAIESSGDAGQKAGVARFRQTLSRFVTMGSPLDKVAFLFKGESLRPWPSKQHRELLKAGETLKEGQGPEETEWWINFYHVLDPVSGALNSPFICGDQPPSNLHIRSGFIPGLAHVAYWTDSTTLRFILGRTYGAEYLKDAEYRPWSPSALTGLAVLGYFTWAVVLIGFLYVLYAFGPAILRWAGKAALAWLTG